MTDFAILALWGAIGSAMYAVPILIQSLSAVPPTKFAWVSLGFSIVVGALMAPILVPILGSRWDYLIHPTPYPLAVGVGLAINPVTPIFINKIKGIAEGLSIGTKK